MNTLEEDFVSQLVTLSTHDNVLFFTNKGRVYKLKGYEVPDYLVNLKVFQSLMRLSLKMMK